MWGTVKSAHGESGGGIEFRTWTMSKQVHPTRPTIFPAWQPTSTVTVHLPQPWIDRLCRLPESGMGYQNALVRLANGDTFKVIIFNADKLELPAPCPAFDTHDIVDIHLVSSNGE